MSEERNQPKDARPENSVEDSLPKTVPVIRIEAVKGKNLAEEYEWKGPTKEAPAVGGTWRPQPRY